MLQHIKYYNSVASATGDSALVSPIAALVCEDDAQKVLISEPTNGVVQEIVGDSITNLVIREKHSGPTYTAIDLNIGVKFANMNVGASTMYDYGDYFAWGEVDPYYTGTAANPTFSGLGYNFTPNGDYQWVNSYYEEVGTQPYNASTLILNDANDVCKVKMGGNWRMPTKAELETLYNYIWDSENDQYISGHASWKTNYNGSGINGVEVTGNGQVLFLPASGGFYGISRLHAGVSVRLWSSIRCGGARNAWCLGLTSSNAGVSGSGRYCGFAVRGVCSEN